MNSLQENEFVVELGKVMWNGAKLLFLIVIIATLVLAAAGTIGLFENHYVWGISALIGWFVAISCFITYGKLHDWDL